jgi:hypothetical protein
MDNFKLCVNLFFVSENLYGYHVFFMCSLFIINIIMGVRAYAPFAVTIKKKINKF